ncbi:MAG: hypothetical protein AABY22_11465 [Nanoarchaeota archaeon]
MKIKTKEIKKFDDSKFNLRKHKIENICCKGCYKIGKQDREKEILEIINNKEKRGVIILDAKIVTEEMISKAINLINLRLPIDKRIELIKNTKGYDWKIKIKSAKIDERNKVCEEIKQEGIKYAI